MQAAKLNQHLVNAGFLRMTIFESFIDNMFMDMSNTVPTSLISQPATSLL